MKKFLLSAVSLAVLSGSALSADLPSRKAPILPPPPPPPMWTGFYAGLNLGGGWSAGNGNGNAWNLYGMNGGVTNNIGSGVIGGGQIGYNYQISSLALGGMGAVIGAEADFQGTSMSSSTNHWGFIPSTVTTTTPGTVAPGVTTTGTTYTPYAYNTGKALNWFGTIRGRIGLTIIPTLLVYGTGGFAYGDVSRTNGGLYGNNYNTTQTGWTAGGGAEWMFLPNWSAKAEYLYTDLSGSGSNNNWWNAGAWNSGLGLNSVNNHTRWNTVRAGVNYHFNWDSAPVVARY
jgi:outer membrane immunogenic protein